MEVFVKNSNLPQGKISLAAVSNINKNLINALQRRNIKIVISEKCNRLDKYESYHADIQCVHLGGENIVVLKECKRLSSDLQKIGFKIHCSTKTLSNCYPDNSALNVCIVGKNIICRKESADKKIFDILPICNVIDVKQGYTKCSVAVVSENAVITSDEGIYKSLKNTDIECLKIRPGFISLPGVSYGFIGGCCGKISYDTLAFTGKIENHPDIHNIKSFMKNHHVYPESLTNEELYDIGGILPLMEYN